MKNLNRRDFIKMLGAIPLLPWLKPEAVEVEAEATEALPDGYNGIFSGPNNEIYLGGSFISGNVTKWNGLAFEPVNRLDGNAHYAHATSIQISADGKSWTEISHLTNEVDLDD